MDRTIARAVFVVLVVAALFAAPATHAQERGRSFDGQVMFDLYNATDTPAGYRRHLEKVFERSSDRLQWSAPGRASARATVKDGGVARRPDGASLRVPAGALARNAVAAVSVPRERVPGDAAARDGVAGMSAMAPVSDPIEFGPETAELSAPATVVLPYDPSVVTKDGLDPNSVRAYAWNRVAGRWEALESSVDPLAKTVSAKTLHLSVCRVFARKPWVPASGR